MSKTPHLDFYKENICTANYIFLCHSKQIDQELVQLFRPTYYEAEEYKHSLYSWGSYWNDNGEHITNFNDFRQNVVLLCAAMNGEL